MQQARVAGGTNRSTAARASKHLPLHLRRMETRLLDLVDELAAGTVEPDVARGMVAVIGRLLDLAKFSLETGEQRELEQRIATLEALLSERRRA